MVTPTHPPDFIYKVASREVYDASVATGRFLGQPVDHADGYIHFSTATQLGDTIRLYFAGLADQVLFQVAAVPLGPALKWEPSRNGALFPHLYSELPMSAVTNVAHLDVPADGRLNLPDWVQ
jgi:uncharacterized protein (DUF952 family)